METRWSVLFLITVMVFADKIWHASAEKWISSCSMEGYRRNKQHSHSHTFVVEHQPNKKLSSDEKILRRKYIVREVKNLSGKNLKPYDSLTRRQVHDNINKMRGRTKESHMQKEASPKKYIHKIKYHHTDPYSKGKKIPRTYNQKTKYKVYNNKYKPNEVTLAPKIHVHNVQNQDDGKYDSKEKVLPHKYKYKVRANDEFDSSGVLRSQKRFNTIKRQSSKELESNEAVIVVPHKYIIQVEERDVEKLDSNDQVSDEFDSKEAISKQKYIHKESRHTSPTFDTKELKITLNYNGDTSDQVNAKLHLNDKTSERINVEVKNGNGKHLDLTNIKLKQSYSDQTIKNSTDIKLETNVTTITLVTTQTRLGKYTTAQVPSNMNRSLIMEDGRKDPPIYLNKTARHENVSPFESILLKMMNTSLIDGESVFRENREIFKRIDFNATLNRLASSKLIDIITDKVASRM